MSEEPRGDRRYRLRTESVAWTQMEPHAVVIQIERDEAHFTNQAAAVLIETLKDGATFDQLVARITQEFEVEAAQAATDVQAFLAVAIAHGVVEESGAHGR